MSDGSENPRKSERLQHKPRLIYTETKRKIKPAEILDKTVQEAIGKNSKEYYSNVVGEGPPVENTRGSTLDISSKSLTLLHDFGLNTGEGRDTDTRTTSHVFGLINSEQSGHPTVKTVLNDLGGDTEKDDLVIGLLDDVLDVQGVPLTSLGNIASRNPIPFIQSDNLNFNFQNDNSSLALGRIKTKTANN